MVSHHFFSQLVLFALLWLFIMLYLTRPKHPVTAPDAPADPESLKPKRHRSNEPKPFEGLTQKPHCALCEQDTAHPQSPPPLSTCAKVIWFQAPVFSRNRGAFMPENLYLLYGST